MEIYSLGEGGGIELAFKVASAFKHTGNRVIGIIGSDSKDSLVFEEKMRACCDELFITTQDGSYGKRGKITDTLQELFAVIEKSTHTEYPELVFAAASKETLGKISDITLGCARRTITREIFYG
jgi:NAD(P)H-flavin reductase